MIVLKTFAFLWLISIILTLFAGALTFFGLGRDLPPIILFFAGSVSILLAHGISLYITISLFLYE